MGETRRRDQGQGFGHGHGPSSHHAQGAHRLRERRRVRPDGRRIASASMDNTVRGLGRGHGQESSRSRRPITAPVSWHSARTVDSIASAGDDETVSRSGTRPRARNLSRSEGHAVEFSAGCRSAPTGMYRLGEHGQDREGLGRSHGPGAPHSQGPRHHLRRVHFSPTVNALPLRATTGR